ncbi:PepSY-associated TM helix domain-containing protein [Massilia sp.]|uniref:PepSY-associated TM helix domain-containing protein n=1 Tax=Massilia sp. TaxID=1882437 RepID=UPI00289EAB65|nr:PepSY-associated TM helix domain-containing protein [Massilia sp.]
MASATNGGLRRSMAWLHAWGGLLAGWLLLVVCITGAASYYRDELTLWMQPEWHDAVLDTPPQERAARAALARLERLAPGADSWIVDLPAPRQPLTAIRWTSPDGVRLAPAAGRPGGAFDSAWLDGAGQLLPAARATEGGAFFAVFHFTLHYMPVRWGRWIVSIAALAMLVAIVSGVIAHRRLFADFFTFRPGKGPRSWLDAHNAFGVLALPYHAMICYSGLVTLMFLTMPWAIDAAYPEGRNAYFAQALPQALPLVPAAGRPAPLADPGPLLAQAARLWDGAATARLTVQRPHDAAARYVLQRDEQGRLSNARDTLVFDATDGRLLARHDLGAGTAGLVRTALVGLHVAHFATPPLRAILFVLGLGACALVATGVLLWTAKAGRASTAPAGLRLASGLNIATVAALPAAIAFYLWLNRLLPAGLPQRATAEVDGFFIAWGVLAGAALLHPGRAMWIAQLGLGAILCAGLPLAGAGAASLLHGGTGVVAGVDLGLLLVACLLGGAALRLMRRQAVQG